MSTHNTPAPTAPKAPTEEDGHDDTRSQALSTIPVEQATNMAMRRELISVRVRVATTRDNHEALCTRAIQLEAQKIEVPEALKASIARASEEHDVAFAIYQARLSTATTEKAAAATAGDALREWRACGTVNILHGKNVPALHDLTGGPESYDPPPPQESEHTVENAARKDSYCAVRASLDKQIESWARIRDQVQNLRLRSEPIPQTHVEALQKAASALLTAEIHMCKMLKSANTNVSAGLSKGSIPVTVNALRTVNWLQALPPPTKADFPPDWKPSAVSTFPPPRNYANQYDLLPIDETDYEEAESAAVSPEDNEREGESEREDDPRAGKKRRGHTDTDNHGEVDLSQADGIVHNRAAEAKSLTAEARNDVIRAMEAPAETGKDDTAAQAEATALARAAIITQPEQGPATHTGEVERSADDPTEAPMEDIAGAKKHGTAATHDHTVLTKAQRISRDSNAAFFKAVNPRLSGEADAIPCHKCDNDICYLAVKSRGDLHPTYQAQLCGNKCGKTSAPSVCLQAWLANGTLTTMLNATTPAMVTSNPQAAPGAQNNGASDVEATSQENRANELDAALLQMERKAQEVASYNATREKTMQQREALYQKETEERAAAFQREREEHAKAVENANEILQAIQGNLTKIRDAQANKTAVVLDPTPAQYVPECPPEPPTTHRHQAVSYVQTLRTTQQPPSGPGAITATAYPPISTHGPQIPRAQFQRAQVRSTYARALKMPARHSTSQQRYTRRETHCMNAVRFILITNFDHCPISQTKEEFSRHLEEGTDVLHYRRMPFQGLEVAVPEHQLASVSQQLRQMGFVLAANYSPSNPMARRRAGDTPTQNADRQAHVAHRAFSKVCDQPRTQIAVKNWFARARAALEARFPHVFTEKGQEMWRAAYQKEAQARLLATNIPQSTKDPKPAGNQQAPPVPPQEDANQSVNGKPTETGKAVINARDNAVPEDK